mgnify:CR=1 FL=1
MAAARSRAGLLMGEPVGSKAGGVEQIPEPLNAAAIQVRPVSDQGPDTDGGGDQYDPDE